VLLNVLGGGNSNNVTDALGQLAHGVADNSQVQQECKTGADANAKLDCAVVADIDSIQSYWTSELPALGKRYVPVPTVWFSGRCRPPAVVPPAGPGRTTARQTSASTST
jgi:uncharacterized protein